MTGDSINKSLIENQLSVDEQWAKAALHNHLDEQVENLDFTVTSKLSAARHRALAQDQTSLGKQTTNTWFAWTTALGSAAVLAIVAITSVQFFPTISTPDETSIERLAEGVLMEDLNLLSAIDDIEFYESVEFLEWMANNSG